MDKSMKLSAPWVTYYHELQALFDEDSDVEVVYDEDEPQVKLFVENQYKADALSKLLPEEKTFGNVTLKVTVIPSNDEEESDFSLFKRAFEGNPIISDFIELELFNNPVDYVVFRNEVVQFFNDEMGDPNGLKSTLYQDIAKDVFADKDGIFFCTEQGY